MLTLANVRRALKHHVLEKMGESGTAGALIAAADVIGDINRVYRRRVVRHDNHAQAVVEFALAQLELRQFQVVIARRRLQRGDESTCGDNSQNGRQTQPPPSNAPYTHRHTPPSGAEYFVPSDD